jgi:hypothetical protein
MKLNENGHIESRNMLRLYLSRTCQHSRRSARHHVESEAEAGVTLSPARNPWKETEIHVDTGHHAVSAVEYVKVDSVSSSSLPEIHKYNKGEKSPRSRYDLT